MPRHLARSSARKPRRAVAVSGTPAYARLLALAILGKAREVDVRRYPGGRKAVMFELSAVKANDERRSITVGAAFFQGALKDYERWPVKWWREAIQNSVDAGATAVECGVVEQPDGTYRVWCQDDGRGMSRDTLLDKFLVLGESGKRDDPSAKGGFGKAKEMLLLPWVSWSVVTGGTRVDGAGIDYEVRDQVPPAPGTRLEVVMPADNHTSIEHAEEFIARCYLKRVAFRCVSKDRYTDGQTVVKEMRAALKPGRVALELEGKAKIHYDKSGPPQYFVRTGGLFMFDNYVPSDVKGTLLVELTGRSIDLLTANRDGIRDSDLRAALSAFTSELSADTKSALNKRGLTRKVYRGTGRFSVPVREAQAALTLAAGEAMASATRLPNGGGFVLKGEVVREIVDTLRGIGGQAAVADGSVDVGPASGACASAALGSFPVKGPDHVEAVVKLLSWQPDFLVLNDREGWKPPRSLTPEGMSKRALAIAKLWAEVVRYVLMRLGSSAEYGVGWCFGEYGAMYSQEQGQQWILLNPLADAVTDKPDELPDPRSDKLLHYLYAAAIHEVTHFADRIDYHNERFASAFTRNVAACVDGWSAVLRIREAVLRGGEIDLHRAVVDHRQAEAPQLPAPQARRERPLPPRERVVEKTVFVDRPVDRWHPAPPPVEWFERAIPSKGAQGRLELEAPAPRPSRGQPQLALKFNGRAASRR